MPQKTKIFLIGIMGVGAVFLFAFFVTSKEVEDQAQAPVMPVEQEQSVSEVFQTEKKVIEINGTVTTVGEDVIEVQEGDTKRTIPLVLNENEEILIKSPVDNNQP